MEQFIKLLENSHNSTEHAQSMIKYFPGKDKYYTIVAEPGSKFHKIMEYKVDGGGQVRYFVENSTGIIYGAESLRKPNFKRWYGTLDTINEWDWSGYYAESLTGKSTLVPKELRRK